MPITSFVSKVLENNPVADDLFKLSLSAPETFSFKAGQFIHILVEKEGTKRWTPYSVLSPPIKKGILDICFKVIPGGFATPVLADAKPGNEFTLRGPFGAFVFDECLCKEHWLIATGTGIAPFYSMLKEHLANFQNHDFKLIFGSRTVKELLFHEELAAMEKAHGNFTYVPTISREQHDSIAMGRVQQHLGEDLKNKSFYICGLKEMVLETVEYLEKRGVDKKFIKFERYT